MTCQTINERQLDQLDCDFFPDPPREGQTEKWVAVTEAAKVFAKAVIENVPWSTNRDLALKSLRESTVMAFFAANNCELAHRTECVATASGHEIRILDN